MNFAALLTIIISVVAVGVFIGVGFLVVETRKDSEEDHWKDAYKKADKFIKKLTLQQKINLLYGTENMKEITPIVPEDPSKTKVQEKQFLCVGRLNPDKDIGFNGMCLQDGPAGIRFAEATSISYQGSSNTAATFNKTLFRLIGESQGDEAKQRGINVLLGPCVNMMRSPQGGRGWEGYGEDPYLAGVAAAEVIKGIQSQGAIACVKHFVANDQETYRKSSSSNMDMPTLMDIYVEPFYRAIRDGHVGSVMSSYNAINNTYVYESKLMMTHILREICGFQGFVVSDWWEVVSNTTATIEAGMDMNMPGGYDEGPYDEAHKWDNYGRENGYWAAFPKYVKDGILSEDTITTAATRIIAAMYQMNQMDEYPDINLYKDTRTDAKIQLQREAATQSQVLLKNNGALPLPTDQKIVVIGSDAKARECDGEGDFQCLTDENKVYNGHMPLGYGSGTTTFKSIEFGTNNLVDPFSAIEQLVESGKLDKSVDLKMTTESKTINGSPKDVNVKGVEDIDAATGKLNAEVYAAIIFLSADSGEEYTQLEGTIGDRPNLDVFHEGNELVNAIIKHKKDNSLTFKTIIVINAPSTVNVPWKDDVDAIIYSGFPGEQSGNGIADVLFGIQNPSGHLPFAWAEMDDYGANIPELENLTPLSEDKTWKDEYRYNGVDSAGRQDLRAGHSIHQVPYEDGLYIGQRWFNKLGKKPIFPFGHGLSYTKFQYSGLELKMKIKGGLYATFTVKNVGNMKGQAVPMLFLTFPDYIGEYPKYILKGFEKVELEVGEAKEVTINADEHAISYFNIEADNYVRICRDKIKVYIAENGDPDQYLLTDEIRAKC